MKSLVGLILSISISAFAGSPRLEIIKTVPYGTDGGSGMFTIFCDGKAVFHDQFTRRYDRFFFDVVAEPEGAIWRYRLRCGTRLNGRATPERFTWTASECRTITIAIDPKK